MTKAEFEKLVTEYGNAAFEYGEYDGDTKGYEQLEALETKLAAAKQAVLDAYMDVNKFYPLDERRLIMCDEKDHNFIAIVVSDKFEDNTHKLEHKVFCTKCGNIATV